MTTQPATTAGILLANQAAANPAVDFLLKWAAENAPVLIATTAAGVAGGTIAAIALALASKFIRNSLSPPPPAAPAPDNTPDIPAADYWEFVYGAVKEAEASGNSGAARMAHYLDAVDGFLDRVGIQGDARRVHFQRLKADAEMAIRALGYNRGTQPEAQAS